MVAPPVTRVPVFYSPDAGQEALTPASNQLRLVTFLYKPSDNNGQHVGAAGIIIEGVDEDDFLKVRYHEYFFFLDIIWGC